MLLRKPRRWARWLIGAAVLVAALAVGGPFVYIHLISGSAPAQLSLRSASGSRGGTSAASDTSRVTADGTWTVASGSEAEYRVREVLVGQSQTAVGISRSVTGHLVIRNGTLTAATFSVPMKTIRSNESQRDAQFDGRIMDVAAYPDGTFTLTSPVTLTPLPAAGTVRTYTVHGNLELHGHTRAVTFTVQAQRGASHATGGSQIKVAGHINIPFAEWGISNPSFGSFVTTQDHGLLEFLLVFSRS
jgi:polyisoprenoid-binding protein YceI